MIEGITFDWWHTVAETPWPDYEERMRETRIERARETLGAEGIAVDQATLYEAYDRCSDLLRETWANQGDLHANEQVEAFLRYAGLSGGDVNLVPRIRTAFGEAIHTRPPVLYPHVGKVLARLKDEGYRVGLVSNTGRTWGRSLRSLQDTMGIGRYLDVRVFSDEIGIRKPNPRIFETALLVLDLTPSVTVHIGDDVAADVVGAKAAGMSAIWFNVDSRTHPQRGLADGEIRYHTELVGLLEEWKG